MKLDSIQSLRAAAAMLVMVYHTRALEVHAFGLHGLKDTPLVSFMIENGFAGVDLFFVISGFIMVYVTGQVRPRPMTSIAFLFARAARIYPLWWLFASIMAGYFLITYGVMYDVERTVSAGAMVEQHPWLYVVWSFLLWPQNAVPIFGLGWTLIHEMHFYLVFALLILLPRVLLPWLLGLWAALVVAGSLYGLSAPFAGNYVQLFFHPLSVEFIAGCYAALLVTSGRRLWPWLITAAGVAIMIAGLILQGDETAFTLGWGRVLWFGIPSFLIVYGFASLEAEDRLKPPQWLVTLGDWSFAIYLAHTFVLTGLRRVFESLAVRLAGTPYADWFTIGAPGRMDNILYYVLGITLSLILSGMVFYLFERPVMKVTGACRRSIFKHTNAQLKPGRIKPAIW